MRCCARRLLTALVWAGVGLAAALSACGCAEESTSPARGPGRLKLATTTSTENSGLLDVLLPPFERRCHVKVNVIAVGTGQAFRLGQNGDADVIMVHDPSGEAGFVEQGFGVNRRQFMHNDFVIVGPDDDPAGLGRSSSAREAFRALAAGGATFVSRGDDSGTHRKEVAIWRAAGIEPAGAWYMEVGQGMSGALRIAAEKKAYALSDRGTYLALRDKIPLQIAFAGDPLLHNPYGIIAVNPARHPEANYMDAMALIAWVTSPEGQAIIAEYRKSGEILFRPDAVPATKESGDD